MFSALCLGLMVAGQPVLPPEVEAQLWKLDAARTFAVSRNGVDANGQPTADVSVKSIPHPLEPTVAHVLRADGSQVSVQDGLADVEKSRAVDDAAGELRSTWLRTAGTRALATGAATGLALAGLVVAAQSLWVVGLTFGGVPEQNTRLGAREWLGTGAAVALAVAGGALALGAGVLAFLGGREVIRAVKTGVRSTPERVARAQDWPVDLAARVVDAHNRAVLRKAFPQLGPPPGQDGAPPPGEPAAPPVIVSQLAR